MNVVLSLALAGALITSPAFADSTPHHLDIGKPATLLCQQYSALRDEEKRSAISWAFGYVSALQGSAYHDAKYEPDVEMRLKNLKQIEQETIKNTDEELRLFVLTIEKRCHDEPRDLFSSAVIYAVGDFQALREKRLAR